MCGILGIYANEHVDFELANRSLMKLRHRGPDSQDAWNNKANIYLGHCRLSIIDLSNRASQPFFDVEKKVGIIFNGEIYNYRELREALPEIKWKSLSDTEVILEGYKKHGVKFFCQLRGIYAFAIYDGREREKVILMRDPSGVKPLYYYKAKEFIFASEIKAIKEFRRELSINEKAIKTYLNLGFCTEPQTAYEEIASLNPGNCMIYDGEKVEALPINQYVFDDRIPLSESTDRILESLLSRAVDRNMVADVSTVFALSGGIDSSLVAGIAAKRNSDISTLTVSFNDEEYDESGLASKFAAYSQVGNDRIEIDPHLDIDLLNSLLDQFDQPFADSSLIPSHFLNKAAASAGTKVLIGGDGGDELFNGYPSMSYVNLGYKHKRLLHTVLTLAGFFNFTQGFSRKLSRLQSVIDCDNLTESLYLRASWFPSDTQFDGKRVFRQHENQMAKNLGEELWLDYGLAAESAIVKFYFSVIMRSDYLRKTDFMSMLNGVEYRVPFLDEDLVRFALALPFNFKSSFGKTKKPLRRLHSKLYHSLGSNASKSGFSIPFDKYLSKSVRKEMQMVIAQSDVSNWVDEKYIDFLFGQLNQYSESKIISRASVYQRILILYSLARWMKVNRF